MSSGLASTSGNVQSNALSQQAGANANADANANGNHGSPNPAVSITSTGGDRSDGQAVVPMNPPAAALPSNALWAVHRTDSGPSSPGPLRQQQESANLAGSGSALTWTVTTASTPFQPLAPTPASALVPQPSDTSFSGTMSISQTTSMASTYLTTPTPWPSSGSGAGSGGSGWWSGETGGGSNAWSSSTVTPTVTDSDLAPTSVTLSSSVPRPTEAFNPIPPNVGASGSFPASPSLVPTTPNGSATLDASKSGLPPSALATLIAFPVSLALMFAAMVALIIIRRRHGSHFGMHSEEDLESGSRNRPPPQPPSIIPLNRDEHQQFLHRSRPASYAAPRMSSAPPFGPGSYQHPQGSQTHDPLSSSFGAASSFSGPAVPPTRPRSPKGRPKPHRCHSVAVPPTYNSPRAHHPPPNRHSHHRLPTPIASTAPKPIRPYSPYRPAASPSPSLPSRPPTSHASRSPRLHPSTILNNLTSSASVSEQAARRISGLGAIPRRPSSLSLSVISRADLEGDGSCGSDEGSDSEEYHHVHGSEYDHGRRDVGEDRVSTFEFEQLAAGVEGRPHRRKSSFFWFS